MAKRRRDTSRLEYAYRLEQTEGIFLQKHTVRTDSSKNYYRARKRSNRRAGWAMFFIALLSIALLAAAGYLFYALWTKDTLVAEKAMWFVKKVEVEIAYISQAAADAIAKDFVYTDFIFWFTFVACNFIGCFAFRREKTMGFPCFLYIIALAACVYWVYTVKGDYTNIVFIWAVVYALLSFVSLAIGGAKGEYFVEDRYKHNPHVWWRYVLLSLFNVLYIVVALVFGIFKLIGKAFTRNKKPDAGIFIA